MKYVRKIAVLLIAAVFIAAAAIGIGVVFAVKNVNVTLYSYTFEADSEEAKAKIAEFKDEILSKVRGNMISTVSEEKVEAAISDGSYYYISEFQKVYPCTLNVVIREHRELFSVENADGSFAVYDENGSLLRTAQTADEACCKADGLPNLVVGGAEESDLKNVARVCRFFADKFKSVRAVADGAALTKNALEDTFTISLRCGVKIIIYNYVELTGEKIDAAYNCFAALSGDKKSGGEIHCSETVNSNGSAVAVASYR